MEIQKTDNYLQEIHSIKQNNILQSEFDGPKNYNVFSGLYDQATKYSETLAVIELINFYFQSV